VLEVGQPPRLRLRTEGCCNGDMWANTGFPAPHVMVLRRGWKTFARAHSLAEGHILHFNLVESDLFSVKVFGRSGIRLGCCAESSTNDEGSSSSDSDEEYISEEGGEDGSD
jgi:hypothetical protein